MMSIGRNCAFAGCGQLDFLPFQCAGCHKAFCLEHRTHHRCPAAAADQGSVIVCPLCARAVKIGPAEDPDLVFDRHSRTDCDPSNYERVHKKKRCPVQGCRERLTTINTYLCRDCGATVCLRHRLGTDHACPGRQSSAAAAATSRFALSSFKKLFFSSSAAPSSSSAGGAAGGGRPAAPARPQQLAPAAAAPRRPAPARAAAQAAQAAQLQQYREAQRQRANPGAAAAATPAPAAASERREDAIDLTGASPAAAAAAVVGGGGERCPQCGARFGSVQELITHAEAAHANGWASGQVAGGVARPSAAPPAPRAGPSGLERCPHCGMAFSDAVELVAHVERQHAAQLGGRENCVLC
eukprot:scaffold5.g849.t1